MRRVAALCLGLLLIVAAAPPAPAELAGRVVTRIDLANPSRVQDAEVRSLFLLAPGDRYDAGRVQRGLALLSQKVSIRTVLVRGEPDGEGVALHLEVVPQPLVRTVILRGNRALSDARLVGRLRTRVDRPPRDRVLAADARALEALYEAEGFPQARVGWTVEPTGSPHWVRAIFRIEEGEPLPIAAVEADGVPLEMPRLLHFLDLRPGDPASRLKLREGVRRVEGVLRREGFPAARAGPARFRAAGPGAVLELPMVSGPATDVRIEGLDEWTAAPLLEVVRSRYGEPLDRAWAERVSAQLVETLRGEGYLGAAVEPTLGERYGRRRVVFHVSRGPQARVEAVRFAGNAAVPGERLQGYMSVIEGGILRRPPFTHAALERDLEALAGYYATLGYLDARVFLTNLEVAAEGLVRLLLTVEEGPRYRWGRVGYRIDGGLSPEEAARAVGLEPGGVANPGAVAEARLALLRALELRGYPEARVECAVERVPDREEVDAECRVWGADAARIGRTVVSGNARTQSAVILRELTLREGEPWSGAEALASRQRLYRLGFFERVRIEQLPPGGEPGVRDVRVEVVEQDAGSVTLGLGYGTEERVKGVGSVSHGNLGGWGRSLGARVDFDHLDRSLAVNFREPWIGGRPMDLRLSVVRSDQDRETFDVTTLGFQASLERTFNEHLKGSIQYSLESNRLRQVAPGSELDTPEEYILSAFGPVVAWDSRDNPFNPTRGYHHTFQAEVAPAWLGSEVRYERYVASLSGYATAAGVTLAGLARGGFAFTAGGTADLPVNKRFFLGGRTTVRAFARDEIGPRGADGAPLGGDAMLNFKAELRFPLWRSLGGAAFWDAGNVWNRTVEAPNFTDLRHAVGGGLRYLTPVGPLALDLAYKLDRQRGESPSAWHFTIGSVF